MLITCVHAGSSGEGVDIYIVDTYVKLYPNIVLHAVPTRHLSKLKYPL